MALLALVVANAMFGASIVAGKVVLERMPPFTLAFVRCFVAAAVLLPLVYWSGGRPARGRGPALLGLTGVALFFFCYNAGIARTGGTNATLILDGGEPIITALLAAAILRERLVGRRALGVLFGLGGVLSIVLLGHGTDGDVGFSFLGDVLVFASAVSWAAYTVVGRRVFSGGDVIAVVTGATLYGLLFLAPVAAAELALAGPIELRPADGVLILYLGAGCSGLTYVLWGYALRRLEANQVGALGNLAPLTGVASAVLFLNESLTAGHLLGGALIVFGVWLATRSASDVSPVGTPNLVAARE